MLEKINVYKQRVNAFNMLVNVSHIWLRSDKWSECKYNGTSNMKSSLNPFKNSTGFYAIYLY